MQDGENVEDGESVQDGENHLARKSSTSCFEHLAAVCI